MYHGLGPDYRPWGGGGVVRPGYPSRLRSFIVACAFKAEQDAIERAGAGGVPG